MSIEEFTPRLSVESRGGGQPFVPGFRFFYVLLYWNYPFIHTKKLASGPTVYTGKRAKEMPNLGGTYTLGAVTKEPIDIIVYEQDDFHRRADFVATMEHTIKTEGVRVYGH